MTPAKGLLQSELKAKDVAWQEAKDEDAPRSTHREIQYS